MKRFLDKVNKTDTCWLWTASLRNGYGAFKYEGKTRLAHRVSFTLFKGEIAEGMLVCHTCDNPKCVNPDHLFLGSHKDNTVDAYQKGRIVLPTGGQFKRGEEHSRHKLTDAEVEQIRADYAAGGCSMRTLGKKYKVDHTCIWQIVRGRRGLKAD